tara:strand:+ start:227 stop:775 length:549 start_codon:yes stop_codon:yes gene_type:complete
MIILDNILDEKELFNIYEDILSKPSWYLSRGSSPDGSSLTTTTFAGLLVKNNGDILDHKYYKYFTSLLPKIYSKCLEEYDLDLPKNIRRVDVVAKQPGANTNFHQDSLIPGAYSLIGMLSPVWEEEWGGEFYCNNEDRASNDIVNHTPGSFIVIKSNLFHNGLPPKVNVPYWRVIVNYILVP